MIFKTKKQFQEAVWNEANKLRDQEEPKRILEVEVGDLLKKDVEEYLKKLKEKIINELKLKEDSFILVPVRNSQGQINIKYL